MISRKPQVLINFLLYFFFAGSGGGVVRVEADGTGNFCGGSIICGKTMMGLSTLIVGTNNYKELMEKAKLGNMLKVNTTSKQLMRTDDSSTYGSFNMTLPIFIFGQVADSGDGSKFEKNDLAAALVHMVGMDMAMNLISCSMNMKINTIYTGGNTLRDELLRTHIDTTTMFLGQGGVSVRHLKGGHYGVLGALTRPFDVKKSE